MKILTLAGIKKFQSIFHQGFAREVSHIHLLDSHVMRISKQIQCFPRTLTIYSLDPKINMGDMAFKINHRKDIARISIA
ncbi:hypothetical protein Scep_025976 [Stephania cephalantha]|uniref:Uncharacterized protein n=1 Tax=Stephania cephalantha TaxID=152367 RepID=A0AAP0EMH1_9MAGN